MNGTEEEIKSRLLNVKKKIGAKIKYLSQEESKQAFEYYEKNGVCPDNVYYDDEKAKFYRIKNKEELEENLRDYALISLLDEIAVIKKIAVLFAVLAVLQVVGTIILLILI